MNIYEIITNKIIEKIEAGVSPWHRPWQRTNPLNFASKREYSGINLLLLDDADPRYMTFKQVVEAGGKVKKGAKGHMVVFWSPLKIKTVTVENEDTGEEETLIDGKSFGKFVLRYYTVFNAVDIEGIDFPPLNGRGPVAPLETAQAITDSYIQQLGGFAYGGDRAYYRASSDHIQMPPLESFESSEGYYSTLFHEMGHSTGHKSRLARKGIVDFDGFGSHSYSYEELVAEMTAAFLCHEVGIETELGNSASYLAGWANVLSKKENQRYVVLAAGQAEKAAKLILGTSQAEDEVRAA